MKGFLHLGLSMVFISLVDSTPIHIAEWEEPKFLDMRSYLNRQDYPRKSDVVMGPNDDRDIYQIIIPKKGRSLMYDGLDVKKGDDIDPEEVMSYLRSPPVNRQYDYYLPELYTENEDMDFDGDLLAAKERAVKRLDDISKAKHKKDLESLLYQANPALTVQKLPIDPQIDFRKFNSKQLHKSSPYTSSDKKENAEMDEEEQQESLAKSIRSKLRGMDEVIQSRPTIRRDRTIRDRQSLEPPMMG